MTKFFKKINCRAWNQKAMITAGKNATKGVTLIELLVALVIFTLVIAAVMGILLNAISANKRVIAKQENIDNARYSMEFMIKELRMAKADADLTFNDGASHLGNTISSSITFTNSADENITYSLSGDGKIMRNSQPISPGNIEVTSLNFLINDWDLIRGSGTAPLITIYMEMKGRTGTIQDEIINLQSSVSPRMY